MTKLGKPLAKFLREYLPHERGVSPHTVEAQIITFQMLTTFAAGLLGTTPCRLTIEDLDTDTLLAFLDHLETERNNRIRTRNTRLAMIKSFYKYLEFRYPQYLDIAARVRAMPAKKANEPPPVDYLNHDEIQALINAPDTSTRTGVRDHAMLCLAYNAGLRVSELTSLPLDSLTQPELNQVRVMGKGRRARILPLWKETSSALHNWLGIRPERTDHHLFLNAYGTGMTRRGFAKRLTVHVKTAAAVVPSIADKAISPHSLRHACALHTLEATGDIRQAALWLGHSCQQTTEVYLRLDPVEKLEILSERPPPDITRGKFDGVQDKFLAMLEKT